MGAMEDKNPKPGFPVDEHGEIFQADLTDELEASPRRREEQSHDADLEGEAVDSQAGDEFMRERKGPK
jgi:hypothetical protein